jgi:hypothetical protein
MMVEAVFATLTVGLLTVAVLTLFGAAARERAVTSGRAQGMELAQALMDEIAGVQVGVSVVQQSGSVGGTVYALNDNRSIIQPKKKQKTEAAVTPSRADFDEITDYDGWTSTPPRDRDGDAIPGADGLTRSVELTEVNLSDPGGPAAADTGVFCVRVTVLRGRAELASVTMIRSASFDGVSR